MNNTLLLSIFLAHVRTAMLETAEYERDFYTGRFSAGVPRDFRLGEHFVLVAHRKCVQNADDTWTAGIFHVFKPTRLEYVVKGDEEDKELERRVKAGVHRKEELLEDQQEYELEELEVKLVRSITNKGANDAIRD